MKILDRKLKHQVSNPLFAALGLTVCLVFANFGCAAVEKPGHMKLAKGATGAGDSGDAVSASGYIWVAGTPVNAQFELTETSARIDDQHFPLSKVSNSKDSLSLAGDTSFLWPGGIVPYVIDAAANSQNEIRDAIATFNKEAPVRFVERTNQKDFVRFTSSSSQFGTSGGQYSCFGTSWIGKIGGMQDLFAKNSSCDPSGMKYVLLHEMGHAVGMIHEHQRCDRDENIKIAAAAQSDSNYQKICGPKIVTPYDRHSIMHYGAFNSAYGRAPTITTLSGGTDLGDSLTLTQTDLQGLKSLYGNTQAPVVTPAPNPVITPAPPAVTPRPSPIPSPKPRRRGPRTPPAAATSVEDPEAESPAADDPAAPQVDDTAQFKNASERLCKEFGHLIPSFCKKS